MALLLISHYHPYRNAGVVISGGWSNSSVEVFANMERLAVPGAKLNPSGSGFGCPSGPMKSSSSQ